MKPEVSLERYTAVVAALGEGYTLDRMLEHESLSSDAWEAAEAFWADRLGESLEGDMQLVEDHDRALAAARARFTRRIEPLDDDLAAWLVFQARVGAAERPTAALAEHGLSLGDLVRLQEAWATRISEDAALRARALACMAPREGGPPPLPEIRPAPRALPPPIGPVGAPPAAPADEADSEVEWGLAAVRGERPRADRAPPPAPSRPATVPGPLPSFMQAAASAPEAIPAPSPVGEDSADQTMVGTIASLGEALPFLRRKSGDENETAPPVISPFHKAVMPFQPGGAPRAAAPRPPAAPPRPAPRNDDEGETIDASPALLDDVTAMPFVKPATPAAQFVQPAAPAPSGRALTLEQHASLCAELTFAPARTTEILAAYQVTPAAKAALDQEWQARFKTDPVVERRWWEAYRVYYGFLTSAPRQ